MKPHNIHKLTERRKFLGIILASALAAHPLFAADYPTAKVNTTGLAVTDTTVTVGQLSSVPQRAVHLLARERVKECLHKPNVINDDGRREL